MFRHGIKNIGVVSVTQMAGGAKEEPVEAEVLEMPEVIELTEMPVIESIELPVEMTVERRITVEPVIVEPEAVELEIRDVIEPEPSRFSRWILEPLYKFIRAIDIGSRLK